METLYLLVPASAILVLVILAVFAWAVNNGQFDDLEQQAEGVLALTDHDLDGGQGRALAHGEESDPSTSRQFYGD